MRISAFTPERWLVWLIPYFLLADLLNGALKHYLVQQWPVSVFYKLLLLLLMVAGLWQRQRYILLLLLLAGAILLPGALFNSYQSGLSLLPDVQLAVKFLAPLTAFCYLLAVYQQQPQLLQQLVHRTMLVSYSVLMVNFVLGLLGIGGTAYQPMEAVSQRFLGIKGLFYSTNELSALLVLLTAYCLYYYWPRQKAVYLLLSVFSLVSALLLLTKTGVLGVLILIVAVPVLAIPLTQWRLYRKPLLIAAASVLLLLLMVSYSGEALLQGLGIYDKLHYVYQQRGLSGILLSSRDLYARQLWQISSENYADWQQWLGVGINGIRLYQKKYFAELDLFDAFIFFGVAGVVVFCFTFGRFIWHSWQARTLALARVVLLLNMLLLLVSLLAGHVISSGMLWLPWAMLNALVYCQHRSYRSET